MVRRQGVGRGGGGETHCRRTYQVCLQISRSLSRVEFRARTVASGTCKKGGGKGGEQGEGGGGGEARIVVATFLLPAKVVCISSRQSIRYLSNVLFDVGLTSFCVEKERFNK